MDYIGRFAPSPTGPLHYGSLVTALASFLDAKHHGGKWLLRIDDLDPPRESPDAPKQIIKQLLAFGLQWDFEVFYQSKRLIAYDYALNLIDDSTFHCICSRTPGSKVYSGCCRKKRYAKPSKPHSVRFRVPSHNLSIKDRRIGLQTWNLEKEVGDFIVKRKDGQYAYQLAVVVDDAYCSVTHIVRGNDLLNSTPRQLALYEKLGLSPPEYLHIPVLVDKCGNKLSKQAFAKPIEARNILDTTRSALADLGQSTHNCCLTQKALIEKAIPAWNPSRIPKADKLLAPAPHLT